jgi:hypothetical protein
VEEQVPTAVKAKRDWGSVTAVIAALIGLLALGVSAYTANLQRQQVRAQVWPYLLVGSDDGNQAIYVYNKGVGPAIVKSAQVFVDGKPQVDWTHVLAALGMPSQGFVQSTINPNVLSPAEEVRIIKIPDEGRWRSFRDATVDRVKLDICYCSTLGECWIYSDRNPVGKKSVAQLVYEVDQCPRIPDADVFNN